MSQLDLSIRAGVSSKHLSFVESGRSNASREMLGILSQALDIPLRERNALLSAAGFANGYRETALHELPAVQRMIDVMLERLEPYPCTVLDRHWNVVRTNASAMRLLGGLFDGLSIADLQPLNAARLLFLPALRPKIPNWEAAAGAFLQRLHREALTGDATTRALVAELLATPDIPASFHAVDLEQPTLPVLPLEVDHRGTTLRLFTTITTLGTPLDVTAEELRVETYFPADDATDRALRA